MPLTRRDFLATATAASQARVLGANDRVRLGIIGNRRPRQHLMGVANKVGGIEWVAVCDAWDVRRDKAAALTGRDVTRYARLPPTPRPQRHRRRHRSDTDHLHSSIAGDACRAGKDVYVEKPMTSLPMQGLDCRPGRSRHQAHRPGRRAAAQHGHFIEAKQRFFDTGLIGPVHMVRTIWNANGGYLDSRASGHGNRSPPDSIGTPASAGSPKGPWDPKRYFNRFAYWDFSTGGQTGGLFVHMVDVVHWYLGLSRAASAVALGGIYQYDDGRDTPDNINGIVEYPKQFDGHLRGHRHGHDPPRFGHHRLHGLGRPPVDLPPRLPLPARRYEAARHHLGDQPRIRPHGQLPRLRPHTQAAQCRRRFRPLLRPRLPHHEHGVQAGRPSRLGQQVGCLKRRDP